MTSSRVPETTEHPASADQIAQAVLRLRGCNVLLDADLAAMYGVATKQLIRAVKRNRERFPDDFLLRLTTDEFDNLKCQTGTSSRWGGRRHAPYAFTEQGVAMLSSVLRSRRAVLVNVEIMRTFVHLRRILASNAELSRRLDALERRYDTQFKSVFDAIRQLMAPPQGPQTRIGFKA